MSKRKIIMVCGPARCGKDLIVGNTINSFHGYSNFRQYAFATRLKEDCEEYIQENFGVSVWDDEQKHIYRDYLIWFGKNMRDKTNGRYLIDAFIEEYNENSDNFIISDFRYINEYETLSSELDVDIKPIYIERYIEVDNKRFTLEPTIPVEIDEYKSIRCIAEKQSIPWIDDWVFKMCAHQLMLSLD